MAQRSGCSARGAGTARAVGSRVSAQDLGGTCSALVFPLALAQAAEFCFSLPLVFEVWAGRGGTILGLKNHWNTEERVVWVGEFSDAPPSQAPSHPHCVGDVGFDITPKIIDRRRIQGRWESPEFIPNKGGWLEHFGGAGKSRKDRGRSKDGGEHPCSLSFALLCILPLGMNLQLCWRSLLPFQQPEPWNPLQQEQTMHMAMQDTL